MRGLELGLVDSESQLFRHQSGEIDGETIGIVESPDVLAVELLLASLESLLRVLLEKLLATIKCTRERLFLLVKDLLDLRVLLCDLGEDGTLGERCQDTSKGDG